MREIEIYGGGGALKGRATVALAGPESADDAHDEHLATTTT